MIYNQKGNTCFGFAAANLVERHTGKAPSPHAVYKFYKDSGMDPKKGTTARTFLNAWKKRELGVKIRDYKLVWSSAGDKHRLTPFQLIRKLSSGYLLAVIKTNNGLELDKRYFLIPSKESTGKHMVAVKEVTNTIWRKYVSFENSWGEDFGDNGVFYVKLMDIYKAFHEIWEVTF